MGAVPMEALHDDPDDQSAVWIVIVSYNTKALTCAALASISAHAGVDHKVIVVDNGSIDGSVAAIRSGFPTVRVLASPINLGFAAACNRAAQATTGRYLLLLNSDTLLLPGALPALLAFAASRPQARIWGGRTLHADGTLNSLSCARRMSLWSVFCRTAGLSTLWPHLPLFNSETYPDWPRDSVREVDVVIGCWCLIERSLWDRLDGFDPGFFFYGEDVDLCLRAIAAGAHPAITPDATIIHLLAGSQPNAARGMAQMLAARIGLVRRHLPPRQRPVAVALIRAGAMLRVFGYGAAGWFGLWPTKTQDSRYVWSVRKDWWDGY